MRPLLVAESRTAWIVLCLFFLIASPAPAEEQPSELLAQLEAYRSLRPAEGGIPEVTVKQRVEQDPGGGWVLVGQAVQDPGPEFKKIHIPLILDFGGGKREVRLVFQEEPTTEFRFDLPSKPRKVQVDPADNNLAIYKR